MLSLGRGGTFSQALQLAKEFPRCLLVSGGLNQNIKDIAFLIHCAPEVMEGVDVSMEKIGANESLGHVLVRQKRYSEAIEQYKRALNAAGSTLTEKDAELGRLYGDLAIAHHLMRDLDKARELYKKAEKILQLA
jgi:tetratricopeptide (TPR) repeat protein